MLDKYSASRRDNPAIMRGFPFNILPRLFARHDLRATAAQVASFQGYRHLGDPVADTLVEHICQGNHELRRMTDQALEHGIETVENPPPALREFFAAVDEVPYWVDPERLDRATRLYALVGREALDIFIAALALSYAAEETNQVLLRSGALYEHTAKRAVRTLCWFDAVTAHRGMTRFSPGYKACIRIRLTHAYVRRAMQSRTDWNHEAWHQPVHQAIYAATLLPIAQFATLGAGFMGMLSFRSDRRDICHLWRFISHLVGIHPSLIPADEQDMWRLTWITLDQFMCPNRISPVLGAALWQSLDDILAFETRTFKGRVARSVARARIATLTNLMLGKKITQALAFPKPSVLGYAAIGALFLVNLPVLSCARVVPGGLGFAIKWKTKRRKAQIEQVVANTHTDVSDMRE